MKDSIKRVLGTSLFASNLAAFFLRNVAVVVAFHRVNDHDDADPLAVSVEAFERHCRFFSRYFTVVPLHELVDKMERGAPIDRHLAITFDDGYRDNYDNARPILEQLFLPATFFIVTDWVGTETVPPWDRSRTVRHPWMGWDEVCDLHARGFEIGAHTRTHPDLGRASQADAQREIAGSRRVLEDRLGGPVRSFAYPYGGPEHLNEPNRAIVRTAGFRCCCSDFGGINTLDTSPFHLNRVPITRWYASPHHFGFDVALGRSALTV
jgi:peptidoglycan/xylan/chitin deacetylase (PgdA/CDA1 family)